MGVSDEERVLHLLLDCVLEDVERHLKDEGWQQTMREMYAQVVEETGWCENLVLHWKYRQVRFGVSALHFGAPDCCGSSSKENQGPECGR